MRRVSSSVAASFVIFGSICVQEISGFSSTQEHSRRPTSVAMKMTEGKAGIPLDSIKAVIFDIDGTLADSWKLGFDATQVVLEDNNIDKISEEQYHEGCMFATPERLARHAGLMPSDPGFEDLGNKMAKQFDDHYVGLVSAQTAGFYPGMDTFLNDISTTIKLGALTNACVGYAHAVLKVNSSGESNFYDRFESIKGADNVPAPKPAPDGLLAICEELAVKPADCVYIGDSATDGKAAEAAGMHGIGVLWGSSGEEKLSKAPFFQLCRTIDDLRAVFNMVCVQER